MNARTTWGMLVLASSLTVAVSGCNRLGSVEGATPGFGTADLARERRAQQAAMDPDGWAAGWTHRETGQPVPARDIWRCEVEAAQIASSSQVGRTATMGVMGSAGGERSLQTRCLEAQGYRPPAGR